MNDTGMRCTFTLSPQEEAFLNRLINDRTKFNAADRETRKAMAMQYLMKLALAAAMSGETEQNAEQAAGGDWLNAVTI